MIAPHMMHDSDLRAIRTVEGDRVLAARGRAASLIRLTLARAYGHDDMATHSGWWIVPHVTERQTIGWIDVADGTAWDSMIEAPMDDILALGLDDRHDPAANACDGDVRIDGELVQRHGESPTARCSAPPGWLRIGLPTWRGYDAEATHYTHVPEDLYRPAHHRLRPRLRALGLVTCYGTAGRPRFTLDDAAGHGSPDLRGAWIHPRFEHLPVERWPMPDELRAAIRTFVSEWLVSVEERLASVERSPRFHREEVMELDRVAAWVCEEAALAACDASGITQLVRLVRPADRAPFALMFAAIVQHRLTPAAEALAPHYQPFSVSTSAGGADWRNKFAFEKLLRPLADALTERFLAPFAAEATAVEAQALDLWHSQGPVWLDQPATDARE